MTASRRVTMQASVDPTTVLSAGLVAVDSVDDPRLSDFRDLKRRPTARATDDHFFVVEGPMLTMRLILSEYQIRTIVVEQGRDINVIAARPAHTPTFALTRDQMRELAGFDFHRGFLASAVRKPLGDWNDFQPDPISLALVNTTDMENLGSMLRTAAAFGIRQVLVDPRTVDPYSRRVMRVSMGAALGMRFLEMPDPAADLNRLSQRGVASLAATLAPDSISVDEFVRDQRPIVVVMGNEAHGLPTSVQQAATARVTIPMSEAMKQAQLVDSLNVSVAAAILIHELTRGQR